MQVAELFALMFVKVDAGSFTKAIGSINKIAGRLRALGAIRAVKNIAEDVYDFSEKTAHAAIHMQALGKSVGLTTEDMQRWSFLAQASGSNVSQFAQGLNQFQRGLRRVAAGGAGKQVTALFASVGIDSKAAAAALRSPDGLQTQLLSIADTYQRLGNTPKAGELLTELFGVRAGRSMAGDFAGGSARILSLFSRATKSGLLSDENVQKLREFRVETTLLGMEIRNRLAKALADHLPQIQALVDKIQKFVDQHADQIVTALGKAFDFALRFCGRLADAIGWLTSDSWEAHAALDAIEAVIGLIVASKIIGVIKSIAGAWDVVATSARAAFVAEEEAGAAGAGKGAAAGAGVGAAEGAGVGAAATGAAATAATVLVPVAGAIAYHKVQSGIDDAVEAGIDARIAADKAKRVRVSQIAGALSTPWLRQALGAVAPMRARLAAVPMPSIAAPSVRVPSTTYNNSSSAPTYAPNINVSVQSSTDNPQRLGDGVAGAIERSQRQAHANFGGG